MVEKVKPWIQKYAPKNSKEVIGRDNSVAQIKKFITNFKNERKKAMILYGQCGGGKTSTVYAIAKEMDLEIIELNASDVRNSEGLANIVGNASKQMSLFAKGKVILLDEIDGVSGTKDRGGIPELKRIIMGTKFPILMTANEIFDKKFKDLRNAATIVEFDLMGMNSIFEILKRIAASEKIECEEMALKSIARRSGGDVRAAVNDLQLLSVRGKIEMKDLDNLSDREQKEELTTALMRVFKTTDPDIARSAYQYVPEDLDEIRLWIDENLPKEYSNAADLARAYDFLSKADVMNRRIRRWQHWRFLVYVNDYLSAGIAISKDEKYKKMISFERSQRPLKIWMANRRYQKRLLISEKIAERTHTSKKIAVQSTYPYVKAMFQKCKDPSKVQGMIDYFDLDKDMVDYLRK